VDPRCSVIALDDVWLLTLRTPNQSLTFTQSPARPTFRQHKLTIPGLDSDIQRGMAVRGNCPRVRFRSVVLRLRGGRDYAVQHDVVYRDSAVGVGWPHVAADASAILCKFKTELHLCCRPCQASAGGRVAVVRNVSEPMEIRNVHRRPMAHIGCGCCRDMGDRAIATGSTCRAGFYAKSSALKIFFRQRPSSCRSGHGIWAKG
jgi:hypothetical protein